jgi:hypothetical protein
MLNRPPRDSADEHSQLGTALYELQVRPHVEAHHHGQIVAIDVDTGEFGVAETRLAAAQSLLLRAPDAQIWCVRIGSVAVHQFFLTPNPFPASEAP